MKNASSIAVAIALIGLSGCVAYPLGDRSEGDGHGGHRDRDPGHDQRDDRHGDGRDGRPDCDPRAPDCPHR